MSSKKVNEDTMYINICPLDEYWGHLFFIFILHNNKEDDCGNSYHNISH